MSVAFAAQGVFEVRDEEEVELIEHEQVCSAVPSHVFDMNEHVKQMFENLTLPKDPGFYTFWVVGKVKWGETQTMGGPDYWEEAEPDVVVIEPATQGCMEYLKNQIPDLTWPFPETTVDPKAKFFVIDPKDYDQHKHQRAIDSLLVNNPNFAKETSGTRYTPDQLRLMASAHIRGLKVDLKTGQIALNPKE